MTRSYQRNGVRYTFAVYHGNNEYFTVTRDSSQKTARVCDSSDFVYKLRKSSILASGGAHGLYRYIDKCLYTGFCNCLAYKVLDYVIDSSTDAVPK